MSWRKGVFFKANPRPFTYMQREFHARWPKGDIVDATTNPKWEQSIGANDDVVLLYPDSVGLGFKAIESKLAAKVGADRIQVLNGRRRTFPFNGEARRALRWRRFLEWTMLPEMAMTIAFLTATPFLLAVDVIRGKR